MWPRPHGWEGSQSCSAVKGAIHRAVLGGPRQSHGDGSWWVLLLIECWPRVGVPRLGGNWVKGSEGRNGLAEWFQVLLWA